MAIKTSVMKMLWAASAGHCSFEGCGIKLYSPGSEEFGSGAIGEMAHICGDKPAANRYNPAQNQDERDGFSNVMVMCPNHHALIDKKENEQKFTVAILQEMKNKHEASILAVMDESKPKNKEEASQQIAALLAENYQAWLNYGPLSEIAQKNPHSESAYSMWTTERLSTIVPNNRFISKILESNKSLFDASEQPAIAAFLVHARSYEKWVQAEVNYEAVVQFPNEFEEMIKRNADAS